MTYFWTIFDLFGLFLSIFAFFFTIFLPLFYHFFSILRKCEHLFTLAN